MVKISIDGKSVQAKEGSTILQNIRDLNIDMPTLCYHEELIPFGACRLCTVEVKTNGKGQLTTACDCQVTVGMDIQTVSDKAVESRKLAAKLLYYKYPTTKIVRETEAEAIAFVVGQTIGLNTGRASADYIHLYHGNAALLAESLEVIQKTSAVILSALENPAEKTTTEAEPEPELAQAS